MKDAAGGGSGSGAVGGRGGWRKGRAGEVALVGPFPATGAGSCGPAVSTRGLRAESAGETATMGGKNKQRTKGNLRVSAEWLGGPGSPHFAAAVCTTRASRGRVERGCREACVCVSSVTSLLCVRSHERGGLSVSRSGICERKNVPCQSCLHPSTHPTISIKEWFSIRFNGKVTWPGWRGWGWLALGTRELGRKH